MNKQSIIRVCSVVAAVLTVPCQVSMAAKPLTPEVNPDFRATLKLKAAKGAEPLNPQGEKLLTAYGL